MKNYILLLFLIFYCNFVLANDCAINQNDLVEETKKIIRNEFGSGTKFKKICVLNKGVCGEAQSEWQQFEIKFIHDGSRTFLQKRTNNQITGEYVIKSIDNRNKIIEDEEYKNFENIWINVCQ